jgi:hypothetical protein
MRRAVMVVCAALLFVPVIMNSRTSQEKPACAAFSSLSSSRISVKVSGAVRHPGIYVVAAKSMADSVIKMAVSVRSLEQLSHECGAIHLENGSAVILVPQPDGSQCIKASKNVGFRADNSWYPA